MDSTYAYTLIATVENFVQAVSEAYEYDVDDSIFDVSPLGRTRLDSTRHDTTS